MRKPRQHRRHQKRRRCKTVFRFETLEQRLALSVTPLAEHFASAAMEAVARGELTSEKWIIREISHERIAEQCALAVQDNFGGQQGWQARPIGSSFFRLSTPGVDPSDVVDWARSQTSRFVVEPDLPIHVQVTPNDSSMNQLYGLHNYGQYGGTVDADIDAIEAWDITTGSQDVVVGVIDSGIDITHPDLAANIWQNPGEIAGNGIDDDGNGFIDDVHGWDFHDDDNTPNDGNGHGTHVAGTIGAVGNNGNGIVGVNWQVSLLPLRFLGDDGYGWTSDAVAAVNYATMLKRDFGINVVATNNSWGGGGYSTTLYQAIQEANQHGIMFVAAAGNNSSNNDVSGSYPANYDLPNVLSVAALNRNDNLAGFSNYGVTTVDVGAPGVSIYSTLPGNSYGSYSGTSMAAPHVAGVVALMHAASPGLSVIDVGHAIRSTVDPVASLSGKTVTGGRINAAAAISSVLGESPVITPLENLLIGVPGAKNIDVVATDSDGGVTLDFTVTDYSGAVPPADVELVGSTLTITPIEGQSGSFTLNVIASDLDSNTSVASFTVEILSPIESNGSVVLNRDASGLLYADESPIYDPGGKHLTINHYSGWETLGVEVVGGENHVLWEYGSTGRLHYWRTDGNWSWQASFGEYYDGSSEYYLAETQFGLDINADGTVGAPVSTEPQDFPSSVLPGISIGSLPSNYETSGLTWHEGMQKLFAVSDEGIVSMMNEDGSDLVHWTVPGDLEAITVADHTSNFVYIGVEHPDSILEFDVSTGQVTRTFSLTDWMTGSPNLGLEALAFVPDESHAEGGVFYAGLQQDGQIYRFELPVLSSQTSTDVLFIDTLTIEGGHPDLADLAYDPSSGLLLAMFDVIDRLKVLEKDGTLRKQWTVPGNQQEAIIYVGNKLFVGDDSTGTISLYTPFESLTT